MVEWEAIQKRASGSQRPRGSEPIVGHTETIQKRRNELVRRLDQPEVG